MIQEDLRLFIQMVHEDLPNADFMKAAGLGSISSEQLLQLLNNCFLDEQ
ncbi:hypothetical protein [Porphyromonas gingivicanis]|nr:hypothetical protein [Porphyromonas gingivicanis]